MRRSPGNVAGGRCIAEIPAVVQPPPPQLPPTSATHRALRPQRVAASSLSAPPARTWPTTPAATFRARSVRRPTTSRRTARCRHIELGPTRQIWLAADRLEHLSFKRCHRSPKRQQVMRGRLPLLAQRALSRPRQLEQRSNGVEYQLKRLQFTTSNRTNANCDVCIPRLAIPPHTTSSINKRKGVNFQSH